MLDQYKFDPSKRLKDYNSLELIDDAKDLLKKERKSLAKLQDVMYAHDKYGVLMGIQGMDTCGKDSLVREMFKKVNVNGVKVHSFKVPNELELEHDYLWRHYLALPRRGTINVFNRTHYENVLVTRVHPEYIMNERIPEINSVEDITDDFYYTRMKQINQFEKFLVDNGTIVLKFFLNLSKDEQKNRLLRRLNKPDKNWKFSAGDLKERKLWDKYQFCYEDMMKRTSTDHAPWYVIPADDKDSARYLVTKITNTVLSAYDFEYPTLSQKELDNLDSYRKELNEG